MANHDIKQGWEYHNRTKHSWRSIRENAHMLDWMNQPRAFKEYARLNAIQLPPQFQHSGVPALEAIAASVSQDGATLDLQTLSQVLFFTAGITRRRKYPGGELLFRAAACTGALYEFEIYIACGSLAGLEAGVYHFGPEDMTLHRLRAGDHRGVLARATADEPAAARAAAVLIFAGTYWRNAWKYQARTYRHFGWDNGTMLANLLAEAAALNLPAKVVMGFVDTEVNALLGLDAEREVAFSMVPLGHGSTPPPAPHDLPALHLETLPLSRTEVDYPAMRAMHAASSLETPRNVAEWRGTTGDFPAHAPQPASGDDVEQVIVRRGSTRVFAREPIPLVELSTILKNSTRGFPADFHNPPDTLWNDLYLIVHAVDGLDPGAYFFRRDTGELELLRPGDFREKAGYLGLEQELPADCSAAVFFLADLERIFAGYGNRGYRAAQLEAGVIGGKLYLGAYALGLGASGLTFYDDDVVEFFSPHAARKSAIFLVALGRKRPPTAAMV